MKLLNCNVLKAVRILGRVGGVVFSREHTWTPTIISACVLSINIAAGSLYLVFNLVNIKALAQTLVPVSFSIMSFTCLTGSVIHRKNYIKLIDEAIPEYETEFPVATRHSKWNLFLVNAYVFGFALFELLVVALYMGDLFIQDTLKLPFPASLPFNTDTFEKYTLGFVIQISSSILGGIAVLVTALFFCNIMEQTCMHYDNLANKIRDQLEQAEKALSSSDAIQKKISSSLHEFLKECVQTHIKLRSRIRVIDETFSTFFLLGLIGYIPTVSGSILEFVSYGTDENTIYFLKFGAVMIGGLFMLFIPCHCGSRIVDAQNKIPEVLFVCAWNRFPDNIQRTLAIICPVGRVPVYVTGGRIMNIDLVGYCQVTGLVYSIFTLLNHLTSNSATSSM